MKSGATCRGEREKYVFTGEWYDGLFGLEENEEFNDAFWDDVRYIKDQVNKELENQKANGIKSNLEAKVTLKYADDANGTIKKLKLLGEEVRFIFITSQFVISEQAGVLMMKIFSTMLVIRQFRQW